MHLNVLLSLLFLSYSAEKLYINLQYRSTATPPPELKKKGAGAPTQPKSPAQKGTRCYNTRDVNIRVILLGLKLAI